MSAFPPHRTLPSIPVTQEIALKYLSSYLEATKSSPHLLPNARLEPSGPSAGSSASSVTIHNLQRVEAGLRGEWLAPKLDLSEGGVEIAQGMDDVGNQGEGNPEEGWMDLETYQREQSVDGPEQAQSDVGAEDLDAAEHERQDDNEDGVEDIGVGVPKAKYSRRKRDEKGSEQAVIKTPFDKEARKKAKRERKKAEQRQKQA